MIDHSLSLVTALGFVPIAFGGALLDNSPEMALSALVGGWVVAALLALAWARPPSGSPEHHPRIDRLFDDTSP